MILKNKIVLLSTLGTFLSHEENLPIMKDWAARARNENPWFTEDNVLLAIQEISRHFLNQKILEKYTEKIQSTPPKKVGIVAAGNIPFVGFHDLISVFLAGHIALIKLSSNDRALMTLLINALYELEPETKEYIKIVERLNDADAFIATGSDNSSRYFEYYFGKKPNIIRKNRSSLAVLNGNESSFDFRNLGNDIFRYFGLGCRNVAKLLVPKGYDFVPFFEAIEYWNTIQIHHKYNNNYDYNKSIYLVNGEKHLDNGFLLLKEDKNLVSPLAVLFYETYENQGDLNAKLAANKEKLQCIVGHDFIPFGQSQSPTINEFADGVNTLEFLAGI